MDRIYTPESFAALLAGAANVRPNVVADFAAGEGALLAAARRRWPGVKAIALDIDPVAVARLKRDHPHDQVLEGDFLDPPEGLVAMAGGIDLVLLNPPFSCRGNARFAANVAGATVWCSRAMAFICRALPFLAPGGELICIVPASCLSSEKDAPARRAIGEQFGVEVLRAREPAVFDGRAVSVALLRIVRGDVVEPAWRAAPPAAGVHRLDSRFHIVVGRGSTSVHELKADPADATTFVHTTDLRAGIFTPSTRRSARRADVDAAAAVLMPRVGRPDPGKVVLVEGAPLVLSDCLFWLRTEPPGRERDLCSLIGDLWDDIARLYGGSCAPYATLAGVAGLLSERGFVTRIHRVLPHKRSAEAPDATAKRSVEARRATAARP